MSGETFGLSEDYDEVLSNRLLFSRIAQENFIETKKWNEAFEGEFPNESYVQKEPIEITEKVSEGSVMTIVFVQITLEAYISDYAFEKLDEEKASQLTSDEKHIKKMWKEIPRVVTNETLTDSQGYEYLGDLKVLRNDIVHGENVHLKSDTSIIPISIEVFNRLPNFYYEEAKTALAAFLQLPIDLKKVDKEVCPFGDLMLGYLEQEEIITVEGLEQRITNSILDNVPC